jgi:uncharacterized phage protein gp47/JayE
MINFPQSFTEVLNRLRNDFQSSNSDSNPFLRTGFLKSLLDSHAGRYFDIYRKTKEVLNEAFIATSSEMGLTQHANQFGLTLRAATVSSGAIIATGVLNETIPSGTEFVSSNGDIFTSTAASSVTNQLITITSITQSGGLATVTAISHQMASGFDVTISGANQTDYNGTFTIKSVTADTFTYSVPSGTVSPATGAITAQSLRAIVFIEANIGGINGNLSANETLDFVVTNPNLNSETAVIFSGLTGGADEETIPNFKTRVLNFAREPVAPFNVPNIENKIKEAVPTATRVFVNEITPSAGQTTIYFVLDGQPSIIPSAATLLIAKAALEDIKPAVVDSADVFVLAPTLAPTNFTFISINPSTQTMRDAIAANLDYLFRNTEEGVNVTKAEYDNVLLNTIDTVTGATLDGYVLSSPTTDITILSGELGTLGNVTF